MEALAGIFLEKLGITFFGPKRRIKPGSPALDGGARENLDSITPPLGKVSSIAYNPRARQKDDADEH
jgi:hypothetical protein